MWQSDRRLYLNADRTEVCEEGDPEAAFLLVAAGGELPEEEAQRYGLKKAAPKPADKAQSKPADKAVRKPAAK